MNALYPKGDSSPSSLWEQLAGDGRARGSERPLHLTGAVSCIYNKSSSSDAPGESMISQATDAKIDIIARECIAVRMRLLNRVVTKVYDDALRPLGLKISQANILVAAWKLGLVNPLKLCQILHLDASTLS